MTNGCRGSSSASGEPTWEAPPMIGDDRKDFPAVGEEDEEAAEGLDGRWMPSGEARRSPLKWARDATSIT